VTRWATLAKQVLFATGVHGRRLRRDPFPGVAVLCYHGVQEPGATAPMTGGALHVRTPTLEAHCRVLASLCTPISGAQFLAASTGGIPLPPRAVLVTFDDGYRGVLTQALPVLARHGIPAVVFACTGPIARGERFWYDAVAMREGDASVERLKAGPYEVWRRRAAAAAVPAAVRDPNAPLSVDELRVLGAHPLIEIGAHTVEHPILAAAPPDEQEREIAGSRDMLTAWLGTPPSLFAYPNGRPGLDYTPDTVARVAAHYRDAFAVGEAFTAPGRQQYEQRRFLMLDSCDGPELAHRLAVSWPRARS